MALQVVPGSAADFGTPYFCRQARYFSFFLPPPCRVPLGASWVPPGCLLGAPGCLLGACWVPLGASWVPPGCPWVPLGCFLEIQTQIQIQISTHRCRYRYRYRYKYIYRYRYRYRYRYGADLHGQSPEHMLLHEANCGNIPHHIKFNASSPSSSSSSYTSPS